MINNFVDREDYHPSHRVYTHPNLHTHIYLGDIQSALDIPNIQAQCITTVVTAASHMDHVAFPSTITHIVYPLLDMKSENITKFFGQFSDLVQRQLRKGNLLVHCAAGISRSSTLVIAYLMKKHSWTFKEAIAFIRKSRPSVLPNLGFQRQLKQYQSQLKQQNAQLKPFEKRSGSKTSQERKHNSLVNRQHALPDIGFMGRTQLKPKLLDLYSNESAKISSRNSGRNSSQRGRQEYQFYGTKRTTFKPLKSKSLADRVPLTLNTPPNNNPSIKLKNSSPVQRVEDVFVRRLHLNNKKVATERQLRIKPLHKLAYY